MNNNISQPHTELLISAQKQFADGDYRESVVLSHIAIEIVADQILVKLINTVQPAGVRPWLLKQIETNHNLGTTKASKLYEALSSDMITKSDLWASFLIGNQLRNDIMHEGVDVSEEQARSVLENTHAMINHLESQIEKLS
ncbi:MAG: hypothetical protein WCI47_02770 [bacterium]